MLLDRAAQLRADLRRHQELRAAGSQAQVFRSRASQFAPLARDLKAEVARSRGLRSSGIAVTPPTARPQLRTRAEELLAKFRADPTALAQADETVRFEFVQGVRKAIEELRSQNQKAWEKTVAQRAEAPSEDVLRALETVPAYRTVVQRIRRALAGIAILQAEAPAADAIPAVLASVGAGVREKDAALGELRGSDLPQEVLTFLRKSGQGGAALSDYTETVERWLEERDLLNSFRIMPVRAP